MSITITVDLAAASAKDIARAAKFMLQFAGYEEPAPVVATPLVPPMGSLGEEVHVEPTFDPTTMPPPGMAFTQSSTDVVAPAAPPVALPPPPPGIEVDAGGVPWDQRIHSGSRAKIADGTWRQKRNLDPEIYKQVMEELRHTMGVERRAPQPPAPPAPPQVFAPAPPVPPIPVAVVPTTPIEALVQAVATEVPPVPFAASAVPPAPPISSTPPVPASAGAATAASPGSAPLPTFPQLMQKITAAFHGKTLSQTDIARAVQKVGLTALPMLAARPDLVADVATELGLAL